MSEDSDKEELSITDLLQEIYEQANQMVRFAEAKNFGLIAFNGGILLAFARLFYEAYRIPGWTLLSLKSLFLLVCGWIIAMSAISLFLALCSLSPQLKDKEKDLKLNRSDNLLFFGAIAHFKPDDYLDALKARYQLESINQQYEKDISRQIVIVSQIAVRKFNYFKVALFFAMGGIVTPFSTLAHKLFLDPDN